MGIEAELTRGDRGVFDVAADDSVVFSKYNTGRFPDDDEIIQTLAKIKKSD